MSAAGTAGSPSSAAGAPPRRPTRATPKPGAATRATLLLALVLALVGVAGAQAMSLLQHALRVPTSDDVAQLVCTAYQSQNYDVLLSVIDPTPVPPAQTTAFDSAARSALTTTLKNLDASAGDVTSCAYQEPRSSNVPQTGATLQYVLTMRRAHVTTDIVMLITLRRQPDGGWKVSRDSDFTGIPGHPDG